MYLIDNELGGTTPLDIILKFKNDDQIIDTTIKAEEEDDLEIEDDFFSDDLFIDLYERLFTEPIFRRLCQHLMIDYLEPNWSQRVNESRSTTDLPEEVLINIGLNQAEIYQGVAECLPELNLASHWPLANRWCR